METETEPASMVSPRGHYFESSISLLAFGSLKEFRIGTCRGLYDIDQDLEALILIAIQNDKPHNGDFEDAIWFFEESVRRGICRRFFIVEFTNPRLREHFLRRGYKERVPMTLSGDLVQDVLEFIPEGRRS